MDISFLREFIVSVPTCVTTEPLAQVWRSFQQLGSDQIVVIDPQKAPVGLLKLGSFVAWLNAAQSGEAEAARLTDHPGLLESVLIMPQHWGIDQIQSHLVDIGQRPVALVDDAGRYQGLLDRLRFLQHLAMQRREPLPSIADRPDLEPEQILLDPLIDLLERLPIPLMLQTTAGRVVTQNLAWRQRVGAIENPNHIRRAAARLLETSGLERPSSFSAVQSERVEAGASLPGTAAKGANPWLSASTKLATPYRTGACRLGGEPDTCICVCGMKNGPDRVWQFVKIPMGTSAAQVWPAVRGGLSRDLADEPSGSYSFGGGYAAEAAGSAPFRLASLKFNPDPDWRSLMQTETLWLVLAQDVTEQQQVAKELAARNADLIQLNRLKDEFLACISHELKTPLTAVLGMSSLLKDQLLGELNERQSRYARLIHQSGRRLIAIINNILDLTRIETGQLELTLEPVSIQSVCTRAYEQARQLQAMELEAELPSESSPPPLPFHLEIQPGLHQLIADELRLRQMLTNLLSNAIKFTEVGGEIGLRVEAWEGWIAFTVWDTGIGIPADKQHLIFQKFQQLENPMTRQFHGTGLGLVLTQRLARSHGGDITFTSVEGEGSQFTLLLPPCPPQASATAFTEDVTGTPANTPSERNRLVLIVDADPIHVEETTLLLLELNYRVAIARSGTEALEKVRRLQPAAVLLNPSLPLLSGWDVLTLLKADEATQEIPVIVTAVRVEKEQAQQNGADAFLSLPIRADALQRCLERLINPLLVESANPLSDLTVLHLYDGTPSFTLVSIEHPVAQGLNRLLHPHHCRVLEVDDLEQADLLARVWKPDLVLLDAIQSAATTPAEYLHQLSQCPYLAELPIITLTPDMTQAAHQIPGLTVFPCLATTSTAEMSSPAPDPVALVQVMQVAAGMNWSPQILIGDLFALDSHGSPSAGLPSTHGVRPPIQALVNYLQTAGLHSTLAESWHTIQQKLQHHRVDVLLLCSPPTPPEDWMANIRGALAPLEHKPAVLVWQYQPAPTVVDSSKPASEAEAVSGQVPQSTPLLTTKPPAEGNQGARESGADVWETSVQVLPPSVSVLELLAQINQILTQRKGELAI